MLTQRKSTCQCYPGTGKGNHTMGGRRGGRNGRGHGNAAACMNGTYVRKQVRPGRQAVDTYMYLYITVYVYRYFSSVCKVTSLSDESQRIFAAPRRSRLLLALAQLRQKAKHDMNAALASLFFLLRLSDSESLRAATTFSLHRSLTKCHQRPGCRRVSERVGSSERRGGDALEKHLISDTASGDPFSGTLASGHRLRGASPEQSCHLAEQGLSLAAASALPLAEGEVLDVCGPLDGGPSDGRKMPCHMGSKQCRLEARLEGLPPWTQGDGPLPL